MPEDVIGYKIGGDVYAPEDVTIIREETAPMADQPVFWLVLQPHGILGIYTDEDEARGIAKATGNVLTHVPADGDYRQQ